MWQNLVYGDVLIQTLTRDVQNVAEFWTPDREASMYQKWMRWYYSDLRGILTVFYVDSFDNFEIYYSDSNTLNDAKGVLGQINGLGQHYWNLFATPPHLLYDDEALGASLKRARYCLFNVQKKPERETIERMVRELGAEDSDADKVCALLSQAPPAQAPSAQKQNPKQNSSWSPVPMSMAPPNQTPERNPKRSPGRNKVFQDEVKGDVLVQTLEGENVRLLFSPAQSKYKKWMRWKFMEVEGDMLVFYFDSSNNFEIYYSNEDDSQDLKSTLRPIADLLSKHKHVLVPVQPSLLYEEDILGTSLKDARLCLFNFDKKPNSIIIMQMVDALGAQGSSSEKVCANMDQILTPSINDVRVTTISPVDLEQLDNFLGMDEQDMDSIWNLWTRVISGNQCVYLYMDAERKLEVYYKPSSAKLARQIEQELESDNAIELVPIPANTAERPLQIARTCLFRYKKKSLDASQDELQDMVRRLGNVKNFTSDKAGIENFYNTMYPTGAARAKAASRDWTWAPNEGKTPIEPKFYFNPKPVRHGGDSNKAVVRDDSGLRAPPNEGKKTF